MAYRLGGGRSIRLSYEGRGPIFAHSLESYSYGFATAGAKGSTATSRCHRAPCRGRHLPDGYRVRAHHRGVNTRGSYARGGGYLLCDRRTTQHATDNR